MWQGYVSIEKAVLQFVDDDKVCHLKLNYSVGTQRCTCAL